MVKIRLLIHSFSHALRGLGMVLRAEQNFRVQLLIAVLAVALGFILKLRGAEMIVILVVSMFVLVLELLNSGTERLVDVVQPRLHHAARDIKDIMAGAVLVSSVIAVIIALIIFVPKIFPYGG